MMQSIQRLIAWLVGFVSSGFVDTPLKWNCYFLIELYNCKHGWGSSLSLRTL